MKKKYDHIEDFLSDKSFKKWVLHKDPESDQYWKIWIKTHPGKEPLLNAAKLILLEIKPDTTRWENERKAGLFLKIENKIDEKYSLEPEKYRHDTSYINPVSYVRIIAHAAVFIVGIISLVVLLHGSGYFYKDQETAVKETEKKESWVSRTTPKGQKMKVHLSDGSIVTLNSETNIRYQQDFGDRHRDLFLSGEAFFEVEKDSLLPFRVLVGDFVTTALGTSFNINSFNENTVSVRLATGKVKVNGLVAYEEEIVLEPGEEALIKDQKSISKRNFDPAKAFLWKEGILEFDNIPFSEVIIALERWYGVNIQIEGLNGYDPLVRGQFENDYLSNVLETIGYSIPFDYKIEQKSVKINLKQP